MHDRDPWWWPAIGVALGLAMWALRAGLWLACMSVLYGIYVWFGFKALIACILLVIAAILHFQVKDVDEGLRGSLLQNLLLRALRFIQRRWDGR